MNVYKAVNEKVPLNNLAKLEEKWGKKYLYIHQIKHQKGYCIQAVKLLQGNGLRDVGIRT